MTKQHLTTLSPELMQQQAEIEVFREYLQLDAMIPSGLRWLKSNNNRIKPGQPAGTQKSGGYYRLQLHGKYYLCHRIILLLNGVKQPPGCYEVDHINRDPSDNRLANLRWVSRSQNCKNRRTVGKVPYKYVSNTSYGRYQAHYSCPETKQQVYVGTYDKAHEAYYQALTHRLQNHWVAA